ncbi:MAG: HpcH/HpaI aldolase family protein [Micromonosporaceae bacterium]
MSHTRVDAAVNHSGQALGTWVQSPNPEACEIAALAGFDFVVIDMEHGTLGISEAAAMIRATRSRGADPVVRVPTSDAHHIRQACDAGATAVIVPGIRTVRQAASAVSAVRYEPNGSRGACPCVPSVGYGTTPWTRASAMASPQVWLLLETPEAVAEIEAVVATGPDAVVLGPFDLSMAMGLDGEYEHPDVVAALERVTATARTAGVEVVYVGLGKTPEENARGVAYWRAKGCRIATTLLDRTALAAAYQSVLSLIRTPEEITPNASGDKAASPHTGQLQGDTQ